MHSRYRDRSGPWKLVWGKIGETSWIADIGYGDGCSHLNPPNNETQAFLPTTSSEVIPASSAKVLTADNGDLTCTESKPCLFNVINDPTEHADPLKTAAANPSVVKRLQQQLKDIASRRFTGHLDQAKHSQDWYCSNVVHKRKWVGPYDDSAPSPSPSPPPPPKPVPAAVAAMVSGTWAQHFYDHKKQWELFRMSVNASEGILDLQPQNCTFCCFDSAHGTVTVPKTSLDSKGEAVLTVVTSGGCTKHMTGTLITDKSAPASFRVTWEEGNFLAAWSDWAKLSDS